MSNRIPFDFDPDGGRRFRVRAIVGLSVVLLLVGTLWAFAHGPLGGGLSYPTGGSAGGGIGSGVESRGATVVPSTPGGTRAPSRRVTGPANAAPHRHGTPSGQGGSVPPFPPSPPSPPALSGRRWGGLYDIPSLSAGQGGGYGGGGTGGGAGGTSSWGDGSWSGGGTGAGTSGPGGPARGAASNSPAGGDAGTGLTGTGKRPGAGYRGRPSPKNARPGEGGDGPGGSAGGPDGGDPPIDGIFVGERFYTGTDSGQGTGAGAPGENSGRPGGPQAPITTPEPATLLLLAAGGAAAALVHRRRRS